MYKDRRIIICICVYIYIYIYTYIYIIQLFNEYLPFNRKQKKGNANDFSENKKALQRHPELGAAITSNVASQELRATALGDRSVVFSRIPRFRVSRIKLPVLYMERCFFGEKLEELSTTIQRQHAPLRGNTLQGPVVHQTGSFL